MTSGANNVTNSLLKAPTGTLLYPTSYTCTGGTPWQCGPFYSPKFSVFLLLKARSGAKICLMEGHDVPAADKTITPKYLNLSSNFSILVSAVFIWQCTGT